jgi:hypothetical protein
MRFVSMLGPSTTNVPEIFPMCPSARNISKASDLLSPEPVRRRSYWYSTSAMERASNGSNLN